MGYLVCDSIVGLILMHKTLLPVPIIVINHDKLPLPNYPLDLFTLFGYASTAFALKKMKIIFLFWLTLFKYARELIGEFCIEKNIVNNLISSLANFSHPIWGISYCLLDDHVVKRRQTLLLKYRLMFSKVKKLSTM